MLMKCICCQVREKKDEIDISLRGEYEDEIWYAKVDISYGDIELDEDGGIGNELCI